MTKQGLVPVALAAITTVAAAPAAHAQSRPPNTTSPGAAGAPVRLSDERTFTRWANPAVRATARARPSRRARAVGRLRFLTEDRFPEVYVLLQSRTDAHGIIWIRLRLPQRPNNVTGWVPRGSLGPVHVVHTRLVVRRRTLRVTLYDHGRRRFSARVGMGKPSTPTPTGHFWIREKFRVAGHTLYGPRAMGTSAYSNVLTDWPGGGVVGMHGTNEPGLIPGRPSHGCMRLRNADILRLYALTPVGTPLRIR